MDLQLITRFTFELLDSFHHIALDQGRGAPIHPVKRPRNDMFADAVELRRDGIVAGDVRPV
jgi:hypothetical protein